MNVHRQAQANGPDFYFVANLLCLDFVNTQPAAGGERLDLLPTPGDLACWLRAAKAASQPAWGSAPDWIAPTESPEVWREGVALRAALRQMAERLAAGEPIGAAPLKAINRILACQPRYPQLVEQAGGYATQLRPKRKAPLASLLPVAESAAWLLAQGDRSLVRRCEGPQCVLFFYDTTRNRSRRWCSMEACGGRAKALAYYRRQRRRG